MLAERWFNFIWIGENSIIRKSTYFSNETPGGEIIIKYI